MEESHSEIEKCTTDSEAINDKQCDIEGSEG